MYRGTGSGRAALLGPLGGGGRAIHSRPMHFRSGKERVVASKRKISADEAKQIGATLGLDWKKVDL